ncbi:hypothetical protein LUZ60_009280 [Juncus effusus]|nr:hypothetical protein LUZ60_009280 [Juncus effusus]
MQLKNSLDEKTELEHQLAEFKTLLEKSVDCIEFSREELAAATNNFDDSVKIEEGSLCSVYKGFLRDTTVAIKMVKPGVELHSKIRHPNIISFIGANPEARALVYDYLPNGSLYAYLFDGKNKNNLPWQERLRIASEICSALIFLHSLGIVHADLKPESVLLDSNLTSKLSDLGLSRKLEYFNKSTTPMHVTAMPMGTFGYLDPEYFMTGELTPQADVYAFGIILLQLVTDRDPRGLRTVVEEAIYIKKLDKLVASSAGKWPPKVAMNLAELGLSCSEYLRWKRPDLSYVRDTIETIRRDARSGHSK